MSESSLTDSLRNGADQRQLRFVDLFAGLGGFHLALRNLGHRCVFASEIDEILRETYLENFGMTTAGDIRDVAVESIPSHDILCAGFPCQPFSKARDHSEPADPELSELYKQILRVIQHHHPQFLILENVPNFERHEEGQTWERVKDLLRGEGYSVRHAKLSPHEFDIPQIRQRIYIVGSRSPPRQVQMAREVEDEGLSRLCSGLMPRGGSPATRAGRPVPRYLAGVPRSGPQKRKGASPSVVDGVRGHLLV